MRTRVRVTHESYVYHFSIVIISYALLRVGVSCAIVHIRYTDYSTALLRCVVSRVLVCGVWLAFTLLPFFHFFSFSTLIIQPQLPRLAIDRHLGSWVYRR